MTLEAARRHGAAVTAFGLLLLDLLLRLAFQGPYPGATALLLAACALTLAPLLPSELSRPALFVAILPALALGSFTVVVTTLSTVGVPLTELSIRAAVAVFVVVGAAVGVIASQSGITASLPAKREVAGVAAVLVLAAFSFAASWDVVGPFPPRGTDWGHYFLYADEVERQEALLIEDPYSGEKGQLFADSPMIGALYGGVRVLDGVSSRSLGAGVALASAFSVMSVLAAAGGLWRLGAGLVAGALYAVAPIRMDPMYWHGLGTTLALVFVPLFVLALGLMFRGRRDPQTIGLLGLALISVAAAHTTTALIVLVAAAVAAVFDGVRAAVRKRPGDPSFLRRWWRGGAVAPLLAGFAVAFVLGLGVFVHLVRQARSLGDPVDYRFFEPDWLTWNALGEYLSIGYLALACLCVLVVLAWPRSARDPALLAVGAVVLASVFVSQLWRLEISYEYRRVVYPFGLALALLAGAAAARVAKWAVVVPLAVLVCAYFAHTAIGLRLPQRLLSERVPASAVPAVLDSVRSRIDRGELPDTGLVVADQCLHFIVPYLLERPSIAAFEEWQVAYTSRLPAARSAAAILAGGPEGRRVASELGAGYVVADPRCAPNPAPGLRGQAIVKRDDVLVVRLPPP